MIESNPNNISAIIGVAGSLLGVTLGYILNSISRSGKIKLFINFAKIDYYNISEQSGGLIKMSEISQFTQGLDIKLNVDFYNTSKLSSQIARDIKFISETKQNKIEGKLKDDATKRVSQIFSTTDDLNNINLYPNEVLNFNLSYYIKTDFQEIIKAKWFIEFKNNNNRLKKIKLNKTLYINKHKS